MESVATNIRLPRVVLQRLKIMAAKERKSLAQLIREAIEKTYYPRSTEALDPKKDPLYKLVGAWESGLGDGGAKHDRDIYGVDD